LTWPAHAAQTAAPHATEALAKREIENTAAL
jgi:hypothetical protein